jgi:hypothetical protein
LPDRVGKEEQFLPSGSVDQGRDFAHKEGTCMVANYERPKQARKRSSVSLSSPLLRVSALNPHPRRARCDNLLQ